MALVTLPLTSARVNNVAITNYRKLRHKMLGENQSVSSKVENGEKDTRGYKHTVDQ